MQLKFFLRPPVVVGALTLTAWYATFFHYRAWGSLVTGFLTALCCLALDHLLRWKKHRHRMLKVVSNPNVWRFDCLLLVIGFVFLALAFLVF